MINKTYLQICQLCEGIGGMFVKKRLSCPAELSWVFGFECSHAHSISQTSNHHHSTITWNKMVIVHLKLCPFLRFMWAHRVCHSEDCKLQHRIQQFVSVWCGKGNCNRIASCFSRWKLCGLSCSLVFAVTRAMFRSVQGAFKRGISGCFCERYYSCGWLISLQKLSGCCVVLLGVGESLLGDLAFGMTSYFQHKMCRP